MTIEEQMKLVETNAKLQEANTRLKKELFSAQAATGTPAHAKVLKKKHGFGAVEKVGKPIDRKMSVM